MKSGGKTYRILTNLGWAALIILLVLIAYFALIYPSAKSTISRFFGDDVKTMGISQPSAAPYPGIQEDVAIEYAEPAARGIVPPGYGTDEYLIGEDVERRVQRTANMDIRVGDADESIDQIDMIAESRGGITESSNISEDPYGQRTGSITIKVPQDQLDAAISDIRAIANRVTYEHFSGYDVTQEYTDLQGQLEHLRAIETRYLELLNEAETVEEILMVEDRLNNTQYQIDYIQGRLNFVANRTDFSTIYVNVIEEPRIIFPSKEFDINGIWAGAMNSLIKLFQSFIVFIVVTFLVIVGLVPYILLIGLVYWIVIKVSEQMRRHKKRK